MDVKNLPTYSKWVSQFTNEDKQYAILLAESIIYVSTQELKQELTNIIYSQTNASNKVGLYSVIDVPFEKARLNGISIKRYKYPYFKNPDEKPSKYDSNVKTGSESIINLLIREICDSDRNKYIDHPSLNELHDKLIHDIFLINDSCGSGEQIATFFEWFYQNRTIKSWISGKHINIHILIYSSSDNGDKALRNNEKIKKTKTSITVCKYLSSKGANLWKPYQRERIFEICKQYGKNYRLNRNFLLGFKKSFSLLVYEYKTPNNVPVIIWGNTDIWAALIPIRPDINNIKPFDSNFFSLISLLEKLKVKINMMNISSPGNQDILILLSLIKEKRIHNEKILAQYSGFSYTKVCELLDKLKKVGWITNTIYINSNGEKVIKKIKKKDKKSNKEIVDNNDFYYPYSIRDSD